MTIIDEELLISRPPKRSGRPQSIRIECQAEERHFINHPPSKINATVKPIRLTLDEQVKPGKFRSEILVENNPEMDVYIKRLRVAFQAHDEASKTRSQSLNARSLEKSEKSRSSSLPRSNSQAILHQWIDDICSNEKLLANDDISFFIKNGEFLARI